MEFSGTGKLIIKDCIFNNNEGHGIKLLTDDRNFHVTLISCVFMGRPLTFNERMGKLLDDWICAARRWRRKIRSIFVKPKPIIEDDGEVRGN